jgi:hypothetical protein
LARYLSEQDVVLGVKALVIDESVESCVVLQKIFACATAFLQKDIHSTGVLYG